MSSKHDKHKSSGSSNPNIFPDPASGRGNAPADGAMCPARPSVAWHQDQWTNMTWPGENGQSSSWLVTNGQTSLFVDEQANFHIATDITGDAGTGGKIVFNSADQIHKTHCFFLHAMGPKESTRSQDSGKQSVQENPAISLYGEGEIAIEATGDDVGIKGDNIVINAVKTLTLKAGEAINIECGDGSGKTSIYTGDLNVNAAFLHETITGAKHVDGSGENTSNHILPGSVTSINSIGSINYTVIGNYMMGVQGRYNLDTMFNINFWSKTGGYGLRTLGNLTETIVGQKQSNIHGNVASGSTPLPGCWTQILGAGKSSIDVKAANGFNIKMGPNASSLATAGLISAKIAGTVTVKSPTIFLN